MELGSENTGRHGIGPEENPIDDTQSMKAVLQEAIDYLAGIFEKDEAVDGATVVEWFSQWRQQAKRALSGRE